MRFGPEEYGGNGDLSAKVRALEALDEKTRHEESEKVWRSLPVHCDLPLSWAQIYNRINKDIISIPGLPPMYDYEHSPQQVFIAWVHRLVTDTRSLLLSLSVRQMQLHMRNTSTGD